MGKRRFKVTLTCDVLIELDDAVIAEVDDEWREVFYDLQTPEEIAEHIAFNLIVNQCPLSRMDGWADMPDECAFSFYEDWIVEAVEAKET